MRITVDFDRRGRVPRIRMKWQSSSNDDLRMQNLGVTVYEEFDKHLSIICNKMNGKEVVYENRGMVS